MGGQSSFIQLLRKDYTPLSYARLPGCCAQSTAKPAMAVLAGHSRADLNGQLTVKEAATRKDPDRASVWLDATAQTRTCASCEPNRSRTAPPGGGARRGKTTKKGRGRGARGEGVTSWRDCRRCEPSARGGAGPDEGSSSAAGAHEMDDRAKIDHFNALLKEGNALNQLGDFRGALAKFEECHACGRTIRDAGLARKVEDMASKGMEQTRSMEDKTKIDRFNALLKEGNALHRQGEFRGALAKFQECRACGRTICDTGVARQAEGAVLGSLGTIYDTLGQHAAAITYHDQSLIISRKIGDRQMEGNTLGNLGLAYDALGRHAEAIEHHDQGLAISRALGDRKGEGADLANIGVAYTRLGQHTKAVELLNQALAIQREIGDRHMEGKVLGNLGFAHNSLEQHAEAIEHYVHALAIACATGDRRLEGQCLGNLDQARRSLECGLMPPLPQRVEVLD